jgi:hypothetical protein
VELSNPSCLSDEYILWTWRTDSNAVQIVPENWSL